MGIPFFLIDSRRAALQGYRIRRSLGGRAVQCALLIAPYDNVEAVLPRVGCNNRRVLRQMPAYESFGSRNPYNANIV